VTYVIAYPRGSVGARLNYKNVAPPLSTKHQRISMRLSIELYQFLKGMECEVFSAPFDIKLKFLDKSELKFTYDYSRLKLKT